MLLLPSRRSQLFLFHVYTLTVPPKCSGLGGVPELQSIGECSQVTMAELALFPYPPATSPQWYPESLHVRISDLPGDSPTFRGIVFSNEVGLSTQRGQYQKSQMYLRALAYSLHGSQRPEATDHCPAFGTAQVRSGAGRSKQPSHLRMLEAACWLR